MASRWLSVFPKQRNLGHAVSKRTLAGIVLQLILQCYAAAGRDSPGHTNPHAVQAVASSWKEWARASVEDIMKSSTWTSYLTFATFYRLDLASDQARVGDNMLRSALMHHKTATTVT